ncbi:MAG: hypothetical protein ACRDGM_08015 [bacterium]
MIEGPSPEVQEAMEDRLYDLLKAQSWWKRYSNTATAIVTNLVLVAWLIVASGTALPPAVQWTVAAVLFAGNVLGIRRTPNGVTPSLIELVVGGMGPTGGRHRLP